jgi:hypothetical protein
MRLLVFLAACVPATQPLQAADLAEVADLAILGRDDLPQPGVDLAQPDLALPLADLAQPPSHDLAQGMCPVIVAANEHVIFGDSDAAGWEHWGFAGAFSDETATVCTGAKALRYTAHQYDGVQFVTDTQPIAATHLSVRAHLDVASDWAVAAVKPGENDPHQFLGTPVVTTWKAGWNQIELDIPATTPETRWILFEKQDSGNATLVLDDLRLR